ncbi:hypothetical protein PRIEUP_LOCUS14754, partial [Pristimantis euphronides]
MDPTQNSSMPPESFMNPAFSAGYEAPPPSYCECTKPPPLTVSPPCIHQSPRIPITIPVYSQDSPPPYSALPPNMDYLCTPYPMLQPTTAINGLPANDVITSDTPEMTVSPPRTSDYMNGSILSLFLCFPLGVLALIYSFKIRLAVERGDLAAAEKASHRALTLNKISRFGVLIIITVVSILIFYLVR